MSAEWVHVYELSDEAQASVHHQAEKGAGVMRPDESDEEDGGTLDEADAADDEGDAALDEIDDL